MTAGDPRRRPHGPALGRAAVARMTGAHRLPDLLKQADRLARGG